MNFKFTKEIIDDDIFLNCKLYTNINFFDNDNLKNSVEKFKKDLKEKGSFGEFIKKKKGFSV